ncbi:DUF1653 domain-containing protein [Clostridium tertium]|uniref:DUF1653 domain-containing protein n=1 Tax=Clostridium tertium TaxID=1559 RepID=UPI0023B34F88|nr:DUF1653 domain-containing protein [Clostridium tertium]
MNNIKEDKSKETMILTDEECRKIMIKDHINKVARHFKGNFYIILGTALNTETNEEMVIYRGLYGNCTQYARPINNFIEQCTQEQFNEYGQKYRFEFVKLPDETKDVY